MFRGIKYLPLSADDQSPTTMEKRTSIERRRGYLAVVIAAVLAFGFTAFIVFKMNQKTMDEASIDIPVENLRNQQSKYHTMFEPRFDYRSLDASSDKLWDDDHLLTPNGGYIVRERNGQDVYFGITMLHQLHCLQALRRALQILTAENNGTGSNVHNLPKSHWPHGSHYLHCFDYLRQVSMSCLH
jgi:Mycotoxin biosynthesis protein UstYa